MLDEGRRAARLARLRGDRRDGRRDGRLRRGRPPVADRREAPDRRGRRRRHALLGRLPRRAAARREPRRARSRPDPGPSSACCPCSSPTPPRATRCSPRAGARSRRCSGTATPTSCRPARCASRARSSTSSRRSSLGRAYALQFHLEVDGALAEEWMQIPEYVAELEDLDGPGAPARMLAQVARPSALGAARAELFAAG